MIKKIRLAKINIEKEPILYMKGQISLDLIFTLIVVLMFISSTVILAENVRQGHEEALLKNQLRIIGSNYSSFITKTQAITDTTFTTKLKLDTINYQGKNYIPNLNFENNLLIIMIEASNQKEEIYFSKDMPLDLTKNKLIEHIIKKSENMGLFSKEDVIVKDFRILEYGNVIFNHGMEKNRKIVLNFLKNNNIESIGRFGKWGYLWSDQSLLSGIPND